MFDYAKDIVAGLFIDYNAQMLLVMDLFKDVEIYDDQSYSHKSNRYTEDAIRDVYQKKRLVLFFEGYGPSVIPITRSAMTNGMSLARRISEIYKIDKAFLKELLINAAAIHKHGLMKVDDWYKLSKKVGPDRILFFMRRLIEADDKKVQIGLYVLNDPRLDAQDIINFGELSSYVIRRYLQADNILDCLACARSISDDIAVGVYAAIEKLAKNPYPGHYITNQINDLKQKLQKIHRGDITFYLKNAIDMMVQKRSVFKEPDNLLTRLILDYLNKKTYFSVLSQDSLDRLQGHEHIRLIGSSNNEQSFTGLKRLIEYEYIIDHELPKSCGLAERIHDLAKEYSSNWDDAVRFFPFIETMAGLVTRMSGDVGSLEDIVEQLEDIDGKI
ncbi:hypothetical protein COV93_06575 [Candidatus Woesearchaeota archaeon CG11_big_fil_rev_8_21_14_0_20_43_8]|nr:MAG: hypothetical protein COV93_06575 [Candidatus Woesearchaeota archaeon CG11_big_fil_rev_8_21_14_0_20_43_8]